MPIATTQLNLGMEAPTEPRSLLDANIRGQQLGALQRSNAETDRANREQMTLADVMRTSQTRDGQFDPQAFATRVVADPSLSAAAKAKAIDYSAPMIRQNAIKGILAKHTGPEGTLHIPSAMNELMAVDPEYFQKVNDNLNNGLPEYIKKKESIVTDAASSVSSSDSPLAAYDSHRMMASAVLSPEEHAKFFPPLGENEQAVNWANRFKVREKTEDQSAIQAQKDAAAMERLRLQEVGDTERARIAAADRAARLAAATEKETKKADAVVSSANLDLAEIEDMVTALKNHTGAATGLNVMGVGRLIPGTPQYDFAQKVEQLKSMLSINARQKLKGSGAISDKEVGMLARAETALSTKLAKADFDRELNRVLEIARKRTAAKSMSSGDVPQDAVQDEDGWTTIDGVRIREIQ